MPEAVKPETAKPEAAKPEAAKPGGGLAQAIGENFSFQQSFGGVRGLLEAVLPMTVFSVIYGVTEDMNASLIAAIVLAVIFAVWRLIARETLTQAISGLVGIGIGAYLAIKTGRAENFVVPSLIKNTGYAAAYAISILVRWPLVGVVLGFALGEQTHWRKVPARARVYSWATWIWVALFGIRLAVQIPLWLAGEAAVLGLVNVVLGLPLFGLAIWATWALVQRVPVAKPPEPESDAESDADPDSGPRDAVSTREPVSRSDAPD